MSTDKYELVKQKLQRFDLQRVAQEEFLILECYQNASIPNKRLVYLDKKSSVRGVAEINRGTATPTPWILTEQYLWFKSSYLIETLASLFKHSINAGLGESILINTTSEKFESILHLFDSLCFKITKEDQIGWPTTAEVLVPNVDTKAALIARSQHRTFLSPKTSSERLSITGSNSDNGIGFVYVMVNELYPKMVKIGFTEREPRVRAAELTIESGLDTVYQPIYALATNSAQETEKVLHEVLADIRVAKEFFNFDKARLIDAFMKVRRQNATDIANWSPLFCYQKCCELYGDDFIGKVIDQELKKDRLEALKNIVSEKWRRLDAYHHGNWQKGLYLVFEQQIKEVMQEDIRDAVNHIEELKQSIEKTKEMLRVSKPSLLGEAARGVISGLTLELYDNNKVWKKYNELKQKLNDSERQLAILRYQLKQDIDKPEIGREILRQRFAVELLSHDFSCLKTITILTRENARNYDVGFIMQVTHVDDIFGGRSFAFVFTEVLPVMTDDEKQIAREDARYCQIGEFKTAFSVKFCFIEQGHQIDGTLLPEDLFQPYGVSDLAFERTFEIHSFGDWFFSEWYKPKKHFFSDTFNKEIQKFSSSKL